MKKLVFIVLLLAIGSLYVRAQSIGPSTINAAGGSGTIGSTQFDWSVGEMTMVSTFTGSSVIVTQGVLQPSDHVNSVSDISLLKQLHVFPNPATSVVNLQYSSPGAGSITYQLMDMMGKAIESNVIDVRQGVNTEQINVSALACATYMLEVTINSGSDAAQKTTYKIQKLK